MIVARTLADGQLLLTDSKAPITLASPGSPLKCHLRGEHTAICRNPATFPIASVRIRAGVHGDVIDARFVSSNSVTLEGGPGNDTLLAPQRVPNGWGGATVSGGGGRNVIVGNSHTTVSYREAPGPVTVDLAKGFGIARGERDHIVGVTKVEGSNLAHNTLVGSRAGGTIWGGSRGNLIVARSRDTSIHLEPSAGAQFSFPSRIICLEPSTVSGIELTDIATGHCKIGNMTLQLPLRSPGSPVLTLETSPLEDEAERHVELLATPAHTLVGEINYKPAANPQSIPCLLDATGRELLRRKGTLNVVVKELYSWPAEPDNKHLWEIFTTVLTVAHSG